MFRHFPKTITIVDQEYKINIFKSFRDSLVVDQDDLSINLHSASLNYNYLIHLFDTKIRPFALRLINRELRELSSKNNFQYNRVSIRNQRSRFGSCSSLGNLNFNWQIILLPKHLFVHIVMHELIHLDIKNHGIHFWEALTKLDPRARIHQKILRKTGIKYFLIKP